MDDSRDIPPRLRRFLEKKVTQLRAGKEPQTRIRRLLDLVDRKRKYRSNPYKLDEYLARFNIRVVPRTGDCLDIDTRVKFQWLEYQDQENSSAISESGGSTDDIVADHLPVLENTFAIEVSGIGVLEVTFSGLQLINEAYSSGAGPFPKVISGCKETYPAFMPGVGHLRVTKDTLDLFDRARNEAERREMEPANTRPWWVRWCPWDWK